MAILGNTLYMATIDAHLVAVDARDGKLLWDKEVAKAAFNPTKWPKGGFEGGLYENATYLGQKDTYPNGCHICEVEVDPATVAEIAYEARNVAQLRHVPLMLASALAASPNPGSCSMA